MLDPHATPPSHPFPPSWTVQGPSLLKRKLVKKYGLGVVIEKEKLHDMAKGMALGLAEALHCERVLVLATPASSPQYVKSPLQVPHVVVCASDFDGKADAPLDDAMVEGTSCELCMRTGQPISVMNILNDARFLEVTQPDPNRNPNPRPSPNPDAKPNPSPNLNANPQPNPAPRSSTTRR